MFEATLPIPPTANNLFPTNKQGRRIPSSKYKEWKERAAYALAEQKIPAVHMTGRLIAEYRFSFPDNRKRDLANFEKGITDLLNDLGFFKDDSQIDDMRLIRESVGDGTVFVTIKEAA